jgi:hypothetical protein
MVAYGIFDSESLGLMQATLDHAWDALPPNQQTVETRERIAQAVMSLATQWGRDKDEPGAVSLADRMRIYLGVD